MENFGLVLVSHVFANNQGVYATVDLFTLSDAILHEGQTRTNYGKCTEKTGESYV